VINLCAVIAIALMYKDRRSFDTSPIRSSTVLNRLTKAIYELLGELLSFSVICSPHRRRDSGVRTSLSETFSEKLTKLTMDARLHAAGKPMEETTTKAQETPRDSPSRDDRMHRGVHKAAGSTSLIDSQKIDMILATTQSIQTSQREVYNMLKAIAPRMSRVETSGPTGHLEVVKLNKKQQDNPYLQGLIKRRRNRDV